MQNEFEKKVQEQLSGFSLNPSEKVWMNVEANIAADKRSKRRILFWWSSAIVILLGSISGWLIINNDIGRKSPQTTNTSKSANPGNDEQNERQNTLNKTAGERSTKKPVKTLQLKDEKKAVAKEQIEAPDNLAMNQDKVATQQKPLISQSSSATDKMGATEAKGKKANRQPPYLAAINTSLSKSTAQHTTNKNASQIVSKNSTSIQSSTVKDPRSPIAILKDADISQSTDENNILIAQLPDTVRHSRDTVPITVKEITSALNNKNQVTDTLSLLSSKANKPDKNKLNSPGKKWLFGLYASAGVSDNVSKLPLVESKSLADYMNAAPTAPTFPTQGAMQQTFNYRSSFSGALGMYVVKALGKKISLEAGLNLHYYSVKTNTGNRVNASRTVYDTLTRSSLNLSTYYLPETSQSSFGQPSSTFTNRYYYLQVPVLFSYTVKKQKPGSLSFSAGLVPGFLAASKALYYNRADRIIYVDKKQFKKFQLSAQAGFSLCLINNSRYIFQAGPQLIMGLNNISKPVYNSSQHLVYMGLGTRLTLK